MIKVLYISSLLIIVTVLMVFIASCTSTEDNPITEDTASEIAIEETSSTSQEPVANPIVHDARTIWDSVDLKANWFTEKLTPNRNLDRVPAAFSEFYEQFISDSTFQLQHIAFDRFIGVIGNCESTIRLTKENWEYTTWNYADFFETLMKSDQGWDNTFYFTNTRFCYQFRIEEVGWVYKTGFEKINGKWQLTLFCVNNC